MSGFDFYKAPASKAFAFGCGVGTLVTSLMWKSPWTGYDITAFTGLRIHRILASQVIFGSIGEMILGLGLVYHFRLFERRMGTEKFVSFAVISTLLSISMQVLFLVCFPGFETSSLTRISPGPYSYIFALFVQYFAYVPKIQKFKVLGIEFSEKSMVYFWSCQLLLSRGRESVITATIGFFSGVLCLSNRLPFKDFKLPSGLSSFGENYLTPLFASRSPTEIALARARHQQQRMGRGVQGGTQQNRDGYQFDQLIPGPGDAFGGGMRPPQTGRQVQAAPTANLPPAPEPTEELINQLTTMGFSRENVIVALRRSHNNVDRAADILLTMS
uniref:UBA domain-containing protein n=1 Tax=Mucochytrium quahogii TaxID=96639 RepID=A0A7S2S1Q9_9STRA|mmetsp:Transcript_12796/g.20695  ORF Transcript_12796/g.20695 Transcript_12796/m.20695 type:complete len:329 (+) Transcript_12796:131-1117(+)